MVAKVIKKTVEISFAVKKTLFLQKITLFNHAASYQLL